MSVWEIIVIGVALAMDAFALTVANCATQEKTLTEKQEWSMPCAFSLFQFLMPLAGYFIGGLFSQFLQTFAKFLTAGIFFILAAKIVFDVLEKSDNKAHSQKTRFNAYILLIQALATSIDALMIGITFAALSLPFSVFAAAGIIGVITFLIVSAALYIGKSLGKMLGSYAVWAGAVILFALAVKNLIEGFI